MRRRSWLVSLCATVACAHGMASGVREPGTPASITSSGGETAVLLGPEVAGTSVIDAPIAQVWATMPAVYAALGVPVRLRDADAHAFGNRGYLAQRVGSRAAEDLLRCAFQGSGPSSVGRHRLHLSLVTTLRALSADRTALTTEVSGQAESVEGTSTERVRCVSTGEIERQVHKLAMIELVR